MATFLMLFHHSKLQRTGEIKTTSRFFHALCDCFPSLKTVETLAKILHIPTYSRLLMTDLIRSCLFLLDTNLLKFLIVFLVRVLSRVSRERISCKTNSKFVHKYSNDSRRSNLARGNKANKQISLADRGLTRSFHWSRAISKTSIFSVLNF